MMAAYRLSTKAVVDLDGIYEYTVLNFGLPQARNYLDGLHDRFEILAQQPRRGRRAERIAPDLRRYEYRFHVVFYVPEDKGVMIVRVLHESMDALKHFIEDETEY